MMGGKAAAEVLLACREAGDFSRRSTRLYERRWMEVFGHDFKLVRGGGSLGRLVGWLAGWLAGRVGWVQHDWQGRPRVWRPVTAQFPCLSPTGPLPSLKPLPHPQTPPRRLPPLRPCSPRGALS
jgi:hypothetical protein